MIAVAVGASQIASSSVVLSNLMYVIGAVVAIIVLTLVVVLRQRKPKSVEANMESFHKGLRALAPSPSSPRRAPVASTARAGAGRVETRRVQLQSVEPQPAPSTEAGTG